MQTRRSSTERTEMDWAAEMGNGVLLVEMGVSGCHWGLCAGLRPRASIPASCIFSI